MVKLDIFNPFSDAPVYYREVTGSTMEDSKKDASGGIVHGTVYMTSFQEKGRGRFKGREWQSHKGQNLMFTLVLSRADLKHDLNFLPLLIGVSLVSSVSEITKRQFQLKWPNDLLYKGKKTAGILCEADSDYLYCGMGINCNQLDFANIGNSNATSLKIITNSKMDLNKILVSVLDRVNFFLNAGDAWRSYLETVLYKKGEIIEVLEGQAGSQLKIKGRNLGIGADGQLIIEQLNGTVKEIYAGEIEI